MDHFTVEYLRVRSVCRRNLGSAPQAMGEPRTIACVREAPWRRSLSRGTTRDIGFHCCAWGQSRNCKLRRYLCFPWDRAGEPSPRLRYQPETARVVAGAPRMNRRVLINPGVARINVNSIQIRPRGAQPVFGASANLKPLSASPASRASAPAPPPNLPYLGGR